jgi:hypothetical protein
MGRIDDACKRIVESVDGAVACGVVELGTGTLLGGHESSDGNVVLGEVVASATMGLFRGPNADRIERMMSRQRGMSEDDHDSFQEVHVTSEHAFHFAKTLQDGRAALLLVTSKTTNIGMGWAQLKAALPEVEPLVP